MLELFSRRDQRASRCAQRRRICPVNSFSRTKRKKKKKSAALLSCFPGSPSVVMWLRSDASMCSWPGAAAAAELRPPVARRGIYAFKNSNTVISGCQSEFLLVLLNLHKHWNRWISTTGQRFARNVSLFLYKNKNLLNVLNQWFGTKFL